MPKPRSTLTSLDKSGWFHCVSRVVDRRFVFETAEREKFAELLRAAEAFSGVRVLTWTMLSNHFHVVVEVPAAPAKPLTDREFWGRMAALYDGRELRDLKQQFAMHHAPEKLRAKYLARMWDLSEFMKTLKLRFSKWFNSTRNRRGTLWEERFRCARIEGRSGSLAMVCAYVDLNAVRAGIVRDPKDYRWCGYAEAVAGRKDARAGLRRAWEAGSGKRHQWRRVSTEYRQFLYGVGEDRESKRGFTPEQIREVWESGGKLSVAEMLRCRLRFFSDGLVLGSQSYLDQFLEENRRVLGSRRKSSGGKPTRGDWRGLCSFRRPQLEAVLPPRVKE